MLILNGKKVDIALSCCIEAVALRADIAFFIFYKPAGADRTDQFNLTFQG